MQGILTFFSDEILVNICRFLRDDKRSLCHLSQTCHRFHNVVNNELILWDDLFVEPTYCNGKWFLQSLGGAYALALTTTKETTTTTTIIIENLFQLRAVHLLRYVLSHWSGLEHCQWNTIITYLLSVDQYYYIHLILDRISCSIKGGVLALALSHSHDRIFSDRERAIEHVVLLHQLHTHCNSTDVDKLGECLRTLFVIFVAGHGQQQYNAIFSMLQIINCENASAAEVRKNLLALSSVDRKVFEYVLFEFTRDYGQRT